MNTERTLGRRRVLGLLAGAGAVAFGACRSDSDGNTTANAGDASTTNAESSGDTTPTTTSSSATTASGGTYSVGEIPSETAGPYPGDGTNGPNYLKESGAVRSDIRKSLSSSATATGVPLDIALTVVDSSTGKALPGATVYLWHADQQGRYSLYSQGVTGDNYLRGVQAADSSGQLTFKSVFPAAYDGRWPHIHFEVFDAVGQATTGRNARKVSQLALPEAICTEVYKASGYEQSQRNMSGESLTGDMVFRDGVDLQMAKVTGSVSSGYVASLVVGV